MTEDDKNKTRCEYPMSTFYTYKEDVPSNVRVSTPEDCQNCSGMKEDRGEDNKHCLITENEGEETEYEKRCESQCPKCGSTDIEWGLSESVSDKWYHQRGSCNNCDECFTEVSELVYRNTIVNGE